MKYLTDFADQAVIIPLVLATAVALAIQGWQRGASVWLIVVTATFVAMVALKLIFLSCSPAFAPFDVLSPSGHVAAATVVAGGLAAILGRRRDIILPVALLGAVVVGISRLALGVHSLPEVLIGALVGLAGAAALLRFSGTPPRLNPAPLIAVIVAVAVLFHGLHLPAEAAIRHTAFGVANYIPACRGTPPFARHLRG